MIRWALHPRMGDGCFSCPGQAKENLTQAALLHNIDPALLLEAFQARLSG